MAYLLSQWCNYKGLTLNDTKYKLNKFSYRLFKIEVTKSLSSLTSFKDLREMCNYFSKDFLWSL